jgi:filamentous hemagglutinin family protein
LRAGRRALRFRSSWIALLAALSCAPDPAQAQQAALPTGGRVSAGSATIGAPSAGALTINQTSGRAVIDWRSFSVGQRATVTFEQPSAAAAVLNRVNGATPSTIAGAIDANGQVFLVNPNGIAITASGSVKVGGGFVGATLGISNEDFQNGTLKFSGSGASAPVTSAGTIATAPGGFVGLLGGRVDVSGTISAPLGQIAIGSGEQATLDLNGGGFLQIAAPSKGDDGKPLVDVSGKVKAAGGRIEIKAATAAQALRDIVNVSGSLSASSARRKGGVIVLDGGAVGEVSVSGSVRAVSKRAKGGAVVIGGRSVVLRDARIDTSGATGGGQATVGGGAHGAPSGATTAARVTVDAATTINSTESRIHFADSLGITF